jgi:hypothetical protein
MNLQLLDLLEPIEDETTLSPPLLGDPEKKLRRLLSINSLISTCSSNAQQQSDAQAENFQQFTKIGAGACGAVFAQDGKSLVVKLAKTTDLKLWNDYVMHKLVYDNMSLFDTGVKVPECYFYSSAEDSDKYFDKNPTLEEAAQDVCNLPTEVLVTQRIIPLPDTTRTHLINKYCTTRIKAAAISDPANRDCLVRLYLGSLAGKSGGMFFSLRNFKLHLNQMVDLQLDVDRIATHMAKSLAVMHWAARTDARDVEYVLGSATQKLRGSSETTNPPSGILEDFFHRTTELWLLDFNLVRTIEFNETGVNQMVESIILNDPYFPKPLQDHPVAKRIWNRFVQGYLEVASSCLRDAGPEVQGLPVMFLRKLVDAQRQKIGLGRRPG